MQMIPSADAIGQTECKASRAMGARTFVTPVAFTHAATLSRASGSGSEGWKTRPGDFSQMNDVLARAACDLKDTRRQRRTSRMKSRLRSVAGACWRSSLMVVTGSRELLL